MQRLSTRMQTVAEGVVVVVAAAAAGEVVVGERMEGLSVKALTVGL